MDERSVRDLLKRMLSWEDAHAGFDAVVADFPADLRGRQPAGLPYSAWQLVDHLRITQHDILDFCVNANYKGIKWPDQYWPKEAEPPSEAAWDASIAAFLKDRAALETLAGNTAIDLTSRIPHGQGQTYLRELVLVADHTSYHVGQLILVRRMLGIWKS